MTGKKTGSRRKAAAPAKEPAAAPAPHAVLSASSSHRWLKCPPSARLCAGAGDEPSPYARQGTDAHALCEYKILRSLGRPAENPAENLEYFDAEMDECTDQYCAYVAEQLEAARELCRDPIVLVEQRLDFSAWVPDGFGTGDCLIVADRLLQVIDFKYGAGILVEAEGNPQMMCYALGALDTYDGIYDIDTVKMAIFQPRRENISTCTLSKERLLQWAEETLKPAAVLAYEGRGEFRAGEHCQFCRAKAECRKRAEYNLELARYDFEMPEKLQETEIAAILGRLDALTSWAEDVKEFALRQALSGIHYEGWKVVEGRSIRRYTDEAAAADAVAAAGYDPYEKKLLGITAMTALLGKKKFGELLGGLVCKPPGKPALAPESDSRPAIHSAQEDFRENEEDKQHEKSE